MIDTSLVVVERKYVCKHGTFTVTNEQRENAIEVYYDNELLVVESIDDLKHLNTTLTKFIELAEADAGVES